MWNCYLFPKSELTPFLSFNIIIYILEICCIGNLSETAESKEVLFQNQFLTQLFELELYYIIWFWPNCNHLFLFYHFFTQRRRISLKSCSSRCLCIQISNPIIYIIWIFDFSHKNIHNNTILSFFPTTFIFIFLLLLPLPPSVFFFCLLLLTVLIHYTYLLISTHTH